MATEAETVAGLARQAAGVSAPILEGPNWKAVAVSESFGIQVVDETGRLDNPVRANGKILVNDAASFLTAIDQRELPDVAPVIYADEQSLGLVAVLNDDWGIAGKPGWRDYRVALSLRRTPEWSAWRDKDGTAMGQPVFAEFIEEHIEDIVDPDGATMLELAQSIEGTSNATFKAGVRLASGARQVVWSEDIDARGGKAGELEIPDRFTIGVRLFADGDPWRIDALLRYRISGGHLHLSYKLIQPERVERRVFDELLTTVVTERDGLHLIRGPAPTPSVR